MKIDVECRCGGSLSIDTGRNCGFTADGGLEKFYEHHESCNITITRKDDEQYAGVVDPDSLERYRQARQMAADKGIPFRDALRHIGAGTQPGGG